VLRERPDLVIYGLVHAALNGIELTRRIQRELPHTKIILMSSHTEDAYRLLASDSGAEPREQAVINDSLLPAIRDVIRRFAGGSGRFRQARMDHRLRRCSQRDDDLQSVSTANFDYHALAALRAHPGRGTACRAGRAPPT